MTELTEKELEIIKIAKTFIRSEEHLRFGQFIGFMIDVSDKPTAYKLIDWLIKNERINVSSEPLRFVSWTYEHKLIKQE